MHLRKLSDYLSWLAVAPTVLIVGLGLIETRPAEASISLDGYDSGLSANVPHTDIWDLSLPFSCSSGDLILVGVETDGTTYDTPTIGGTAMTLVYAQDPWDDLFGEDVYEATASGTSGSVSIEDASNYSLAATVVAFSGTSGVDTDAGANTGTALGAGTPTVSLTTGSTNGEVVVAFLGSHNGFLAGAGSDFTMASDYVSDGSPSPDVITACEYSSDSYLAGSDVTASFVGQSVWAEVALSLKPD